MFLLWFWWSLSRYAKPKHTVLSAERTDKHACNWNNCKWKDEFVYRQRYVQGVCCTFTDLFDGCFFFSFTKHIRNSLSAEMLVSSSSSSMTTGSTLIWFWWKFEARFASTLRCSFIFENAQETHIAHTYKHRNWANFLWMNSAAMSRVQEFVHVMHAFCIIIFRCSSVGRCYCTGIRMW